MGKFSGNGWVKFAQMVLDHLNITKINGKELASLIDGRVGLDKRAQESCRCIHIQAQRVTKIFFQWGYRTAYV